MKSKELMIKRHAHLSHLVKIGRASELVKSTVIRLEKDFKTEFGYDIVKDEIYEKEADIWEL